MFRSRFTHDVYFFYSCTDGYIFFLEMFQQFGYIFTHDSLSLCPGKSTYVLLKTHAYVLADASQCQIFKTTCIKKKKIMTTHEQKKNQQTVEKERSGVHMKMMRSEVKIHELADVFISKLHTSKYSLRIFNIWHR